ncbi:MAG: AraC family transcriptional regulator [Alphaproteobacteria bacterium]
MPSVRSAYPTVITSIFGLAAGTDELLGRHPFVRSNDPEAARREVSKIFAPHRMSVVAGPVPFEAAHNHVRLNTLSLNFIRYSPEVVITAAPSRQYYLIVIPLVGRSRLGYGDQTVENTPGHLAVLNPLMPLRLHFLDCAAHLVVKLDRQELEATLAEFVGHTPVQPILFDFTAAIPYARCQTLVRLLGVICADVAEERSTFASRPGERPTEALLMNMILQQLPHNYSDRMSRPASRAAPFYVKRVEEFIRLHAPEAIRLKDMVAVSGVSARTLFKGFRQFRGMGPMAYLKMVRLEHVHAELGTERAGRAGKSVTAIANAWGFEHLGNFAMDYKKRYGVRPSETLRQRAR